MGFGREEGELLHVRMRFQVSIAVGAGGTGASSKHDDETVLAGTSGLQEMKVFDCKNEYKPTGYIKELEDGWHASNYLIIFRSVRSRLRQQERQVRVRGRRRRGVHLLADQPE